MNNETSKKPVATRESAKAMYTLYQWMFGKPLPPFDIYLAQIRDTISKSNK